MRDALALLKEQEAEIDEVSDEYIDLGKEMAKQPKLVRCKDCTHHGLSSCPMCANGILKQQTTGIALTANGGQSKRTK